MDRYLQEYRAGPGNFSDVTSILKLSHLLAYAYKWQYNHIMGMRTPLSLILKGLSKWAIRKHELKLIVVAGSHGTKLTSELICELLSPDVLVRKQLEKSFWDYSIPLAILGYEDKQYSFIEWLVLIFRATASLLFGRRNFCWVILQMNTHHNDIARYWADIVQPEITVLVHQSEKDQNFERLLIQKTQKYVVIADSYDVLLKGKLQYSAELITVGSDHSCDLCITHCRENMNGLHIKGYWKKQENGFEGISFTHGEFIKEPLSLAIAVALLCRISPEELPERLMHMQVDVERFLITAPARL